MCFLLQTSPFAIGGKKRVCTIGEARPALPAHVRSVLPSNAYMSAPKSARSHEGGQPQQENTRRSGVNKCPMLYTHHPLPSSQAFPKADRLRQGKAELVSRASKAPSPWLNLGGTEPRESPGPASSQETSIVGRPRGPWRDPALALLISYTLVPRCGRARQLPWARDQPRAVISCCLRRD